MLKTICCRGRVLQLSPNWGGVKSSGGITEMDRHKMPYHAAINAHVLHYVVSNHAFTDIEQSTGKALLQPLPRKQKRSGP